MYQLCHFARDAAFGIGILAHPPLEWRFADLPRQSHCTMDL